MADVPEINANIIVIAMLNAYDALTAMVDSHIWSPRLPSGFSPINNGPGISLFIRGGMPPEYDSTTDVSFQVTTWGIDSKTARAVMSLVMRVLNNAPTQLVQTVDGTARVFSAVNEVYPQDVEDSDTGWNTCVGFFNLKMQLVPRA